MAEALGAASAVAGLLSLSGSIIAEGYTFLSTVYRAPKELRDLLREAAALNSVLDQLQSFVDKTSNSGFEDIGVKELGLAELIHECEESLLVVQRSVQRCQAVKGEQVKNLGRRILWPFKEKETKETFDSVSGIETLDLSWHVDQNTNRVKLQGISRTAKATAVGVNELRNWTFKQDQLNERRALIKWLNPHLITVEDNLRDGLAHRHSGTGEWFFNSDTYKSWLSGRLSPLLIHGIPGSGKTVLASSIIQTILTEASPSTSVVYFFCDHRDSNKRELQHFLAVGIIQLLDQHPHNGDAIDLFREHHENMAKPVSVEEQLEIFTRLSQMLSDLYVVIDALDECKRPDEFVNGLRHFMTTSDTARVLITGRNDYSLGHSIHDFSMHRIALEQNVESDISAFVAYEINARIDARKLKIRSPDLKKKIIHTLSRHSDGMFLWAAFQLDLICRLTNDKAIREALYKLPRGLENTYIRLLEQIKDNNLDNLDIIIKALTWIVSSIAPLTLSQLAEAISIEPGDTYRDVEKIINDENDLLQMLGSLVRFEPSQTDPVISLAHFTLYEFLSSSVLQGHESLAMFFISNRSYFDIGVTYAQYLSFADFRTPCDSIEEIHERISAHPLLLLAAQTWYSQMRSIGGSGPGVEKALPTLEWFLEPDRKSDCKNFSSWQQIYHGVVDTSSFPRSPMPYAIDLNAVNLFPFILQRGHDPTELYQQGYTELHVAVITGSEEKVASMLKAGWNPNKLASREQTALHLAAGYGHYGMVKLLLDAGASIHAMSDSGSTPFYRSARNGSIPTIELLYEAGSDIDAETWDGWTPIFEAVENMHLDVVEWLIKKGARLNQRLLSGCSLVEFARAQGDRDITELIERALAAGHS
ncbi:MAG: hypothetical protein Q9227_005262 [Pyrenula ochraceoflavens]